jgi:hypothetical protein
MYIKGKQTETKQVIIKLVVLVSLLFTYPIS